MTKHTVTYYRSFDGKKTFDTEESCLVYEKLYNLLKDRIIYWMGPDPKLSNGEYKLHPPERIQLCLKEVKELIEASGMYSFPSNDDLLVNFLDNLRDANVPIDHIYRLACTDQETGKEYDNTINFIFCSIPD
jgi:hypothetical protein